MLKGSVIITPLDDTFVYFSVLSVCDRIVDGVAGCFSSVGSCCW